MTIYAHISRKRTQLRFWWRYVQARLNPPPAEKKFKEVMGWRYWWYGFRHQYPVWIRINRSYGKVTKWEYKRIRLDFAVQYKGKLINIELDGKSHETRRIDDWERDFALRAKGWITYRFQNKQVYEPDFVKRVVYAIRKA